MPVDVGRRHVRPALESLEDRLVPSTAPGLDAFAQAVQQAVQVGLADLAQFQHAVQADLQQATLALGGFNSLNGFQGGGFGFGQSLGLGGGFGLPPVGFGFAPGYGSIQGLGGGFQGGGFGLPAGPYQGLGGLGFGQSDAQLVNLIKQVVLGADQQFSTDVNALVAGFNDFEAGLGQFQGLGGGFQGGGFGLGPAYGQLQGLGGGFPGLYNPYQQLGNNINALVNQAVHDIDLSLLPWTSGALTTRGTSHIGL